ncbi:hypothetical protein D3C72_2142340 [compost metagenome]
MNTGTLSAIRRETSRYLKVGVWVKKAIVRLYFLTGAEGGQERLITSNFSNPIIFEEDRELKHGLWSAGIEFINKPNQTRQAKARAHNTVFTVSRTNNKIMNKLGEVAQ